MPTGSPAPGLRPRDRVLLISANRLEWLVVQHAVSIAGGAAVLANSSWKHVEIRHALELTTPCAIVADGDAARTIDDAGVALPSIRICLDAGGPDGWTQLDELTSGASDRRPDEVVDDTATWEAALPFSSGTTGLPKAVRHSHRGLVRATMQRVDAYALGDSDRLQFFMPLFTIFGVVVVTSTFASRARLRMFRRFEPPVVLQNVEDERITVGFGALPIATTLAARDDLERYDLSSLRYLLWGATPLAPEVAGRLTRRSRGPVGRCLRHDRGRRVVERTAFDPTSTLAGSVGFALADTDVRVVDTAGREVPADEVGEIQVRSDSSMLGYVGDEPTFTADGWYPTGDLGHVTGDGWIFVTDRLKDIVKVNGFSVAPAEIERVVLEHPGVVDSAAYGVPDPVTGEALEVAVVVAGPSSSVDDIAALLLGSLAAYQAAVAYPGHRRDPAQRRRQDAPQGPAASKWRRRDTIDGRHPARRARRRS